MKYASRLSRLFNFIIDWTVIFILAIGFYLLFYKITYGYIVKSDLIDYNLNSFLNISLAVIYILYYFLLEFFFGVTIGKIITATKVVGLNGKKVKGFQILKRSLIRLIPIDWITYFKKNPIGWHDSLSDTIVIQSK